MSHRFKAAFAAAVAVLAIPASASAATKVVLMGTPPTKDGKAIGKLLVDVNDFFPNGTTIHVGDKVQFTPVGFHNTDLPKKGGAAAALLLPTGQNVTGLNDAAGNPFWFNGAVPQVGFNPILGKSNLGKTLSYDGSKGVNSGLPGERQAEADDRQVHEDGHVRVLLRHPSGHEGLGQGARQEQEDPVGQG